MSLAANDAFSLGLAHNGPRRRSTRSSSPKISAAALFAPSPQGKGRQNIRRRMIRRLSNLQPVSVDATDEIQEHNGDLRHIIQKDSIRPATPHTHKKSPPTVDWEIPRKTLHSSIGVLSCILVASFVGFTTCHVIRISHNLSLCISWIPTTYHSCIVCNPCHCHTRRSSPLPFSAFCPSL
jgi:hypothetical protein